LSEEALHLFIEMSRRGTKANRSAFACVLSTCADKATLECGTQLHAQLFKAGYGMGCFVGNALLALYFKCGSMEDARKAFDEMHEKDTASWNTMISGYARHGFGLKAWEIFELMKQTQIKPDDITLV
jgi:pentatricopeptide repeat protein